MSTENTITSKYLKIFQDNAAAFHEVSKLRGHVALIERLPKEEIKTAGGLYLGGGDGQVNSAFAMAGELGIVLLTSNKEPDSEGNTIDSDLEVGNVVLIPDAATTWYSSFPLVPAYTQGAIGMVFNHQLRLVFKDIASYLNLKEQFTRGEAKDGDESKNGTQGS